MSFEETRTDRDRELRRMLVATASAAPARPRRRGMVAASIAAFALAGALTGGAVSAAALNAPAATIGFEEMKDRVVRADTPLLGTPITLTSQGETTVELGPAPTQDAELMMAFQCKDPGIFDFVIGGWTVGTMECEEAATGGWFLQVLGSGPHTLTIETADSNGYALWASWTARPIPPAPSESQTAALADGVVTEAEYRDGFARYRECMTDAGHPLLVGDESGTIIEYSSPGAAVTSGDEGRCYAQEFAELDVAWQIANEYTSHSHQLLQACLEAAGITLGGDVESEWQQLRDAGIDPGECLSRAP